MGARGRRPTDGTLWSPGERAAGIRLVRTREDDNRPDEYRPAEDASVLGRVLSMWTGLQGDKDRTVRFSRYVRFASKRSPVTSAGCTSPNGASSESMAASSSRLPRPARRRSAATCSTSFAASSTTPSRFVVSRGRFGFTNPHVRS